jgi:hypothetical protein
MANTVRGLKKDAEEMRDPLDDLIEKAAADPAFRLGPSSALARRRRGRRFARLRNGPRLEPVTGITRSHRRP